MTPCSSQSGPLSLRVIRKDFARSLQKYEITALGSGAEMWLNLRRGGLTPV
jgi:hypothetical protein